MIRSVRELRSKQSRLPIAFFVRVALAALAGLEISAQDCKARDRDCVAPHRFSALFVLEKPTDAKYLVRHRRPPSQTCRTFLHKHVKDLVSADFFVVPTATFQLLFVLVILSHDRRRPVHFVITSHPTAEWTARQLVQAFPWDSAPRFLLRDRDGNYGKTATVLGIRSSLRSALALAERACQAADRVNTRECLDHVIILHESGLRGILRSYFDYYARSRTHLSLDKDAPIPRAVQPAALGRVIELPEVGGLHHRYERRAA